MDNSLQEILGVNKTESKSDIRKAQLKLALIYHPDKNQNSADAEEQFKGIHKAYTILQDDTKRELQDRLGVVDEDASTNIDEAVAFFSKIFKEVNENEIDDYLAKYKGGDQEIDDMTQFFKQTKGKIKQFVENIIGSEIEDTMRQVGIFDDIVKSFPAYKEAQKKDRAVVVSEQDNLAKSAGKRKKVKARKPKEDILDSDDDMESKPKKSPKKEKDGKSSKKEEDSKKLMEAIVSKKEKRQREGNDFLSNLMSKYVTEGEMYDDPFAEDDFPTAKKINKDGGAKKNKKNK